MQRERCKEEKVLLERERDDSLKKKMLLFSFLSPSLSLPLPRAFSPALS